MVNFKVEQEELEGGMYIISLYHGEKFVKKIAECYEEDYAYTIAGILARSTGGKVIG